MLNIHYKKKLNPADINLLDFLLRYYHYEKRTNYSRINTNIK